MVIILEIELIIRVQIQNEAVCASLFANALRKGMNPSVLPPAESKTVGKTEFFSLGKATCLREGKL